MWRTLPALAGVALVLSGCGGGGSKKANTSPAELKSQTVHGDLKGNAMALGIAEDITSKVIACMDADTLDIRLDTVDTARAKNVSIPANVSVLWQPSKKRVTWYTQESAAPMPSPCMYYEMADLPPADQLVSLLKDELKKHKPTGMDGDYRRWVFKFPKASNATGQISVDLDDGNGLRKASMKFAIKLNGTSVSLNGDFKTSSVKLAKPNASIFEVPSSWGKCEPGKPPVALLAHISLLLGSLGVPFPLLAAAQASTPAEELLVVV